MVSRAPTIPATAKHSAAKPQDRAAQDSHALSQSFRDTAAPLSVVVEGSIPDRQRPKRDHYSDLLRPTVSAPVAASEADRGIPPAHDRTRV